MTDRDVIAGLTDPAHAAWFRPAPRSGVVSAWYGHVPFAYWLIEALRPRVVVELGTQNGVSYAAFCDASASAGLDAKIYAVDTSSGDPPVDAEFSAFHDERYGAFSRLLRMTSDEAAAGFASGSIDLLHIDGCHDADAVFETWQPKLSARAVVLLHGTNVRERGFDIWRSWSRLSGEYPSFEFVHEQGLGVLGVGPELEGPVGALCRLTDAATIATLRQRFAYAGARSATTASQPSTRTADAARREAERLDLIAVAQELRAADIRRRLELAELGLAETRLRLSAAEDDLVHRKIEIAHLREFAEAYHTVIGSTLWRAVQPLSKLASKIPRSLRRALRQAGTGALWAATPWRLSARLAERRERIARANAPPALLTPPLPPPKAYDRFSLEHIAKPSTGYVPLIRWFDPIAPEVSIIVVNWNGGEMTLLCLQHLWQHTSGHHYEIIVVDNGSDAAELERLREQAPFAQIVALGANRYFGDANNIGVEAARGRYVCLLNNDAFVPLGWLEPLIQVFGSEERVGAVGPRLVFPDGRLQSAGGLLGADASLTRLGLGGAADDPDFSRKRIVDFVPAVCLLVRREDFLRVLGFDLAWEPATYDDVDLCLKLGLLGLQSIYCPDTTIVHIENATGATQGKSLRLETVAELNRAKFLGRWRRHLETAGAEHPRLFPDQPASPVQALPAAPRLRVLIYTPYQLTPGGGERYILTIAEAFRDRARVALVTPCPISRLRLLTMAREFRLALDQVELLGPAALADRPEADLAFVLGNDIFPPVGRLARHNLFICQFPFPFKCRETAERHKKLWRDVEMVLTYSDYVREHVQRQIALWQVPYRPVELLPPPVPMVSQTAPKRPGMILHVGRFIADGHCKRQDRLIEALQSLHEQGVAAELHLAGSTMPEAQHRAFYAELLAQAEGLPVHFHPNCSTDALHLLYAQSDLYWHATGVGADIGANPQLAEHFGISVVEAMSARCIPIVFAAGGPASIVADGVTGYHFHTVEELAAKTMSVLAGASTEAMRDAAAAAAQQFDEPTFRARVQALAERVTGLSVLAPGEP